jgi:hypothetical protein
MDSYKNITLLNLQKHPIELNAINDVFNKKTISNTSSGIKYNADQVNAAINASVCAHNSAHNAAVASITASSASVKADCDAFVAVSMSASIAFTAISAVAIALAAVTAATPIVAISTVAVAAVAVAASISAAVVSHIIVGYAYDASTFDIIANRTYVIAAKVAVNADNVVHVMRQCNAAM